MGFFDELGNFFTGKCGIVTRISPRSCDPGWAFWDADLTTISCVENCGSHSGKNYNSRAADNVSCWLTNAGPLTIPIPPFSQVPPKCGYDYDEIDSLCYKKCPYSKDPIKAKLGARLQHIPGMPYNCMGDKGISYTTQNAPVKWQGKGSYEAGCERRRVKEVIKDQNGNNITVDKKKKDNNGNIEKDKYGNDMYEMEDEKIKISSLCYKRCSDVYGPCYVQAPGAGLFCVPQKLYSYRPAIADPACPSDYAFDGVQTCNNSYIFQRYNKATTGVQCPNGHDNVAGLCYHKCPTFEAYVNGKITTIQTGKIGLAGQCSPPHNGGYKASYQPAGSPVYFPGIYTKVRKVGYSTK